MRIAILSGSFRSKATQSILKAGEKAGHEMTVLDPSQLFLMISQSERGYDRLYDGYSSQGVKRVNIKDFDAVIPRIGSNSEFAYMVLDHIVNNLGIWSAQEPEGIKIARNKLRTLQICSANGIRTPRTVYADSPKHFDFIAQKLGGFPLIIKTLTGSQGTGVMKLDSGSSSKSVVQSLYKTGERFLLQEYVPCQGQDFRVIVLGGKVVAAMRRTAKRGEFRANLSQGANGEPVDLSEEEKSFCIRAAQSLGLSIAGVDFIRDKDGQLYLIEINSNPGWKICSITGVALGKAYIQFVEASHGKSQSHSHENLVNYSVENERLEKECKDLRNSIRVLIEDPFIQSLYKKTKGKRLAYRDRENSLNETRIDALSDLHQVIAGCVRIL